MIENRTLDGGGWFLKNAAIVREGVQIRPTEISKRDAVSVLADVDQFMRQKCQRLCCSLIELSILIVGQINDIVDRDVVIWRHPWRRAITDIGSIQ